MLYREVPKNADNVYHRCDPYHRDRLLPFLGRRLGASAWIESAFAISFSSVSR